MTSMPPKHLNFLIVCGFVCAACYATYQAARPAMMVGDALQLIDQFYIEPVDGDKLLVAAMQGITSKLDSNSSFIQESDFEAFENTLNQEFAGIGIMIAPPQDGFPVRVLTPIVGSPALQAGFLPGDFIVGVADQDVSQMEIGEVSKLLRGPIGTSIDVTVRRPSPAM